MRTLLLMKLALAAALLGQSPSFEVASVKAGGDIFSTRPERSGGRLRWTTQLCYLIGYAYNLDFTRLTGHSCGAVYSLDAAFDPSATEEQVRLMVQSLLADRFKFRAHRADIQVDGYALTVGKGGLKISETKDDDPPSRLPEWARKDSPELRAQSLVNSTLPEAGIAAVFGRRASMEQLAQELSRISNTPFWDRTGLSGSYYFTFRYLRDLNADPSSDAPSLATALRETLGIRLEKQKGPRETLVIDELEPASDN